MHIELTPEALLTQLDYPVTEQALKQIDKAIANTGGFEHFSKHILSLKDTLSHYGGIVALSNSHPYFKIKCDADSTKDTIEAFTEAVISWGDKYKVSLQKVDKKPTYYILGQK